MVKEEKSGGGMVVRGVKKQIVQTVSCLMKEEQYRSEGVVEVVKEQNSKGR